MWPSFLQDMCVTADMILFYFCFALILQVHEHSSVLRIAKAVTGLVNNSIVIVAKIMVWG